MTRSNWSAGSSVLVLAFLPTLRAFAQTPSAAPAMPSWVDFDADGRVDLGLIDDEGRLHLFRNESESFREVTAEAGLAKLGAVRLTRWADFDRDGRPDLLVVSAAGSPSLLSSPGGSFEAVDALSLRATDVVAAEWLETNGDGWTDLWLARPEGALLLANERGRSFRSIEFALPAPAASEATFTVPEEAGQVPDPARTTETTSIHVEDSATSLSPGSVPQRVHVLPSGTPSPGTLPVGPGGAVPIQLGPNCAKTIDDRATGNCLSASSTPILGALYPLSSAFNVDSSGRVGIGATGPTHRLTVSSPNDDALRLIGAGIFGSQARLNFGDGDLVHLYEDVDDSLEIHSTGRTAFTGGPVGIGTKAPVWPLHVVGTQAVGRFDSTNAASGSVIELRNQTVSPTLLGGFNFVNSGAAVRGQILYRASDDLTFSTGAAERMRIDSAGKVGIGTSSPTARFHAVSTTTDSAVRGTNTFPGGTWVGVWGEVASPSGYGLYSIGNSLTTGAKFFVQPHPTDPSKEVRFACLEGNESGTYFRSRAVLHEGAAEIEVPEDFRLVTEPEDLTVQLTTIGRADVWVESYDLDRIVVRGDRDVEVHVLVQGVRRGFQGLETIIENHAYVPEERGVPYGTQYPDELRKILVENGILNADFTPNEATAARLGWTLADRPAKEATVPRSLP